MIEEQKLQIIKQQMLGALADEDPKLVELAKSVSKEIYTLAKTLITK